MSCWGRAENRAIKPIRAPRETAEVVRAAVAVAFSCYEDVIVRYVPGDIGAYRAMYTRDGERQILR